MIVFASVSSPLQRLRDGLLEWPPLDLEDLVGFRCARAGARSVARYRWITSVNTPGELKYAPSDSHARALEVAASSTSSRRAVISGGFVGFELARRQFVDVTAGGVPVLAQQADAIVGVDGHRRGAAGMAHDLERQAHAVGQVHRVDAHLDDAAVVDLLCDRTASRECTCPTLRFRK